MAAITDSFGKVFRLAAAAFVLGMWVNTGQGEVQTLSLPADYADFALHPQTGSIAAVAAETNEVAFFRHDDLASGKTEPAAKLRVGSTPCSIVYKHFGDKHVFAVVCSQDSHMYLFDAGGVKANKETEFVLLKKIELSQSGVSFVTGSINPEDPFLYYCYGSGHDSTTGVVSLRDLNAHGAAFDDSMDCAISASGQVAYRRGPWSPSGFESLILANSLADDKPQFSRLFYDHDSTAAYVPDPFDRYTAAGTKVFTRDLEKHVAGLDFVPQAFFKSRPVVVGLADVDSYPSHRSRSGGNMPTLRAASYNTFTSIGDSVTIAATVDAGDRELPRGISSDADYKVLAKRYRVFADDVRERVVVADRNRLQFVPLADFDLPDEPFLLATLEGASQILAQRENRFTLKPMDNRVETTLDEVPDGLESDGLALTWKPDPDQVGPAAIVATIKHGDIERTLRFDLTVTFPSIRLPFSPAGFSVAADAKRAVIWDGPALDPYGRPQGNAYGRAQGILPSVVRIAVLDLTTAKVQAERKVAEQIGDCIVTDQHVILRPAFEGSPKCEILRIQDLQREKALVARGPISRIAVVDNILIVQTESEIEIFDAKSFERLRIFSTLNLARGSALRDDGLFVQGVLYGFDLEPKLFIDAEGMTIVGGMRNPDARFFVDSESFGGGYPVNMRNFAGAGGRLSTSRKKVPESNTQISLDSRSQQMQVPGSTHTWRTEFELSLTASGDIDARQVIVRKQLYSETAEQMATSPPVLQVAKREAYVVYGKDLYRWQVPTPDPEAREAAHELSFLPKQSTIALAAKGSTTLKHTLRGSKPPVNFFLLNPPESMKIDASSGEITIDNEGIRSEAVAALESDLKSMNRGEPYAQTLSALANSWAEIASTALGRRPKGIPVAVPIAVSASDSNLASASLQYFVIAEIPNQELIDRLQAFDAEREKERLAMQAAQATQQSDAGGKSSDLGELKRKIDALEQRIDLMTRQLNLVLKKLDEKE